MYFTCPLRSPCSMVTTSVTILQCTPTPLTDCRGIFVNTYNERYDSYLWGLGIYRAFISHDSAQEELAVRIQNSLNRLSISSFVSSNTIGINEDWPSVILYALNTTNFLVALVTDDFHSSPWANQEVGYAYAQNTPIIAIMLDGVAPKGLLQTRQALNCTSQDVDLIVDAVHKSLFQSPPLFSTALDVLISAYSRNPGPELTNHLIRALSQSNYLSEEQEKRLIFTFNMHRNSYHPLMPYTAIADSLKRLTGNNYTLYEPSPEHQQLIVLNKNDDVHASTGLKCTHPGIYQSNCHHNNTLSIRSGQVFPSCMGDGRNSHFTLWTQLFPSS